MKDFLKTVLASAIGYVLGSFILFAFMILFIIGTVTVVMFTHGSKDLANASVEEKSILFVNVEGDIEERKTSVDVVREIVYDEKPKDIALYELSKTLKLAASDKKIKGVLLRLRYASAGWSKLESLRNMLKEFKKSGKFIHAYSEAYDEKLYYLATVADEIYLYPKGEFEWDGLSLQSMFFKKTLAKLEVEPQLIRAGRFKSAGEAITQEKMSAENRLQLTELSDSIWKSVVGQKVADRKGLSVEGLNAWAKDLSVSNAQQAYNLKLVDQLLPIEELEQKLLAKTGLAADEDLRLVGWNSYYEITRPKAFGSSKNQIAVIMAEGEISMGTGSSNSAIYSDDLSGLIRELNDDDEVKAVVLRVNSPGGSALASDVIWRSLEYLKKKKKVVTSFSDMAASGGYYIAAGSDYIYAEPTTITGSIGVFGIMFNTREFFDNKLGVTFDLVKTHDSADMMSGSRSLTAFEKNKIQEQVDYTYSTFLNVVQEGRKGMDGLEAVKEVAEGRVWSGAMAKDIGLVDAMGNLDDAINKAATLAKLKDYEVVLYPDEKKFLDKIFDSLGGVFTLPTWLSRIVMKSPREEVIYTRLPMNIEMQ